MSKAYWVCFAILQFFLCRQYGVHALLCYETVEDEHTKKIVRDCPECTYCGIMFDELDPAKPAGYFAMTNEVDDLDPYVHVFGMGNENPDLYNILSTCILEKYKFGEAEYKFRCLCNQNFCNDATSIQSFLSSGVKKDMGMDKKTRGVPRRSRK